MKPAQIVLVEDNAADVLLIKLALKESRIDHALLEYESGEIAVQSLSSENGAGERVAPDAILIDLNTPMTDGFDAVIRLQQLFTKVPITILTSSRARSDKERAQRLGVSYLEKPSQLNDFLTQVGAAIQAMLPLR